MNAQLSGVGNTDRIPKRSEVLDFGDSLFVVKGKTRTKVSRPRFEIMDSGPGFLSGDHVSFANSTKALNAFYLPKQKLIGFLFEGKPIWAKPNTAILRAIQNSKHSNRKLFGQK